MISNWVWILGFSLFLYLDPFADFRQKHIFAFVGIAIAIFAHFIFNIESPQYIWSYSALGIVFIIIALSSQFSGTSRNSGTLYAFLFLIPLTQSIGYMESTLLFPYSTLLMISSFTVILILVHSIIYEAKSDYKSKVSYINIPVLIALVLGATLLQRYGMNPFYTYVLWLLAILFHVEKKVWVTQYPIPLLLLIVHLLLLALPTSISQIPVLQTIESFIPTVLIIVLIALFLWMSLSTEYISKIVFYTILVSKFLLVYNASLNTLSTNDLAVLSFYHTMLSLSLFALTVQLETTANQSLTINDIKGIVQNRRRVILMWFLLFTLVWVQPLSMLNDSLYCHLFNTIYGIMGLVILVKLIRVSLSKISFDYHIIRPSIGIWIASLSVIIAYISHLITNSGKI